LGDDLSARDIIWIHLFGLISMRSEEKMATKDDIKDIRHDILNLGDRFVSYHMFDKLASRVHVLEKKQK